MSYFNDEAEEKLDLSKARDRGSKKWVAMMLPEHVKLIRQYNEESQKVQKPELCDWELDIIQESIQIAMKRNVDVHMKIWKDGVFFHHYGKITWVDVNKKTIEMEDTFQAISLMLNEVVDVTVLE